LTYVPVPIGLEKTGSKGVYNNTNYTMSISLSYPYEHVESGFSIFVKDFEDYIFKD